MTGPWLVLVESNTTGSGRLFCSCARQLGLRPVLLARDPARYPYVAADDIDFLVTDTGTDAAVLAACRELGGQVAGVTSSSEYFIATAAQAARALGRPHPAPEAVRACRDKHAQRVALSAAGVAGPAFAAARTPDEAAAAAAAIGYPVVVKPASGTGSIAVRRCETPAEVRAATEDAFAGPDPALPPQHTVLVEEYLTGAEYSAELIDDQVVGITAKRLGGEPYFVEIGHDFPAPLAAADAKTIGETAVAAVRALGLGWGGAHVELRFAAGANPRVVEVNPRLAGGMIPRAVQEAIGVDMIFHVVAAAAGRPVPLRPAAARSASIRFLVAREAGTLAGVLGVADARQLPGVVEVGITAPLGQPVVPRHSFRDRLGYVIAAAADAGQAAGAADAALARLTARITEGAS
ncbi:MAG: ATP-grasp domain-containing protein [Streptosporangiaceae bacterium]|jgi:biotin carboxylase